MLSTLITHFLNRELATKDSKAREELLYDEAFTIVKVRPGSFYSCALLCYLHGWVFSYPVLYGGFDQVRTPPRPQI